MKKRSCQLSLSERVYWCWPKEQEGSLLSLSACVQVNPSHPCSTLLGTASNLSLSTAAADTFRHRDHSRVCCYRSYRSKLKVVNTKVGKVFILVICLSYIRVCKRTLILLKTSSERGVLASVGSLFQCFTIFIDIQFGYFCLQFSKTCSVVMRLPYSSVSDC